MKTSRISYRFYATLLDSFETYRNSDTIWEKYWGFSEEPPHSPEEFHEMKFQELIDRINRVPFDSDVADRGTVFNEIIDCIVEHHDSKMCKVTRVNDEETGKLIGLTGTYKERSFTFPWALVKEVSDYYKGCLAQQYIQGILPTRLGDVLLYGYIDYVAPLCTHDLKTTGRYAVGNYKDHSQHLVYPYCLAQNGADVEPFEYNIVQLNSRNWQVFDTYTELYNFKPERDIPILTNRVEDFIDFLEDHRDLITDKKIFNQL